MDEESIFGHSANDVRKDWLTTKTSFSWADYVNVVLMESGYVSAASIQSLKSGNLWAGTPSFKLSSKEVRAINEAFSDDQSLRALGIRIAGRHFTFSRMLEGRIMVGRDAKTGSGCVLYRCKQCLVTAVYGENNHPGYCYSTVVQLGDYLFSCGF